jgi:hypothetical protein
MAKNTKTAKATKTKGKKAAESEPVKKGAKAAKVEEKAAEKTKGKKAKKTDDTTWIRIADAATLRGVSRSVVYYWVENDKVAVKTETDSETGREVKLVSKENVLAIPLRSDAGKPRGERAKPKASRESESGKTKKGAKGKPRDMKTLKADIKALKSTLPELKGKALKEAEANLTSLRAERDAIKSAAAEPAPKGKAKKGAKK